MDLKQIANMSKFDREKYIDELRRMRTHVNTALTRAPAAATVKLVEMNLSLIQSIWVVERSLTDDTMLSIDDWISYAEMLEQAIRNYSEDDYNSVVLGRPDRVSGAAVGQDLAEP